MDWSKGFSSAYYMMIVDPVTWRDVERVEITNGSISRSDEGLRQSADIDCTEFDTNREKWVRIYLDAAQEGDVVHTPLFTGLSSVPERSIDGTRTNYPLTCYSVLKPAEDILLQRGWYAPKGFNGAELVGDLLSSTPAPIVIEENAPNLTQSIIAESGESHLTMVNKILEAINWQLRIKGDGTITVCPLASETSAIFGLDNDVIEPKVSFKSDWFDCPNVFRVTSNGMTAIARDDEDESMLSTVTRGREIWIEDSNGNLNDGEGLEQYASRRLKEEQSVAYTVSYTRRFDPDILVGDVVEMHYPGQNLTGKYTITSQNIELSHGAKTSEEVKR